MMVPISLARGSLRPVDVKTEIVVPSDAKGTIDAILNWNKM